MAFDFSELEDILVCPKSKSNLVLDKQSLVSVDPETRLRYPIRDDIPIMLVDEATELSQQEWSDIMQSHGRDPLTGQPGGEPGGEAGKQLGGEESPQES